MPLYYFDVHDGDRLTVDYDGTELADNVAAREEAKRALSEIGAEVIPRDGPERLFVITVRDSRRIVLFEMRLNFHSRSY